MLNKLVGGVTAIAAISMATVTTPISAADISSEYKNRTVTILVGYGSGGTYGRTSLLLGEHMDKVIPGKPNMVVQHMPGAGGIKAANFFYNVAPKNGRTLLMPPEMSIVSELLRPKKVKYRCKQMTWLGRVFGQNSTIAVRRDSGVTSMADLKNKKITMASSGKGSPTFLIPATLNALLGTKMKIIKGYKGSRRMQLAMEQGEVHGIALGWTAWISAKPHWFKGMKKGTNNYAIPLVQSGYTKQKGIEHVPLIREFLPNKEDRQVAMMLGSASVLGRGLVLPPGAPKKLVKPLRAAFAKITKNKRFIKDAYKRGLEVNPLTGKEIQKIVNDLMDTPKATVKRARGLIFGKK